MTPLRILKDAVREFEQRGCRYCLIGGHAASLYRTKERVTRDVDFAIAGTSHDRPRDAAEEIIRAIGLEPVLGFIPGAGENAGRIAMITSQPRSGELTGMIDILLPELPWVVAAVERAQFNKIDLGFQHVPVITPEDLILAKCCALRGAPDRFQDLDDLKEIFTGALELDCDYLKLKLEGLSVTIPKLLRDCAPRELRRLCR